MGPYSHPLLSHYGSPRLPQSLFLLLRTCLAGPSNHPDPVAYTDLSVWQSIRRFVVNFICLLNPFALHGDSAVLNWVGMVRLTAFCGVGSALWICSNRNGKGKRPASSDASTHAIDAADVGKSSCTVGNVTCCSPSGVQSKSEYRRPFYCLTRGNTPYSDVGHGTAMVSEDCLCNSPLNPSKSPVTSPLYAD